MNDNKESSSSLCRYLLCLGEPHFQCVIKLFWFLFKILENRFPNIE